MKIGYKRLLSLALTGTLASGLCMQSSAFSFPSAYWPLQAAWFEATEAQDMDATISTAQKTYELFKDDALCQEICEIWNPIAIKLPGAMRLREIWTTPFCGVNVS